MNTLEVEYCDGSSFIVDDVIDWRADAVTLRFVRNSDRNKTTFIPLMVINSYSIDCAETC